jgi:uncharacterized protein DUF885
LASCQNNLSKFVIARRITGWPGQAFAYKMGQLTIRKLCEEAKAQLGPKFDIKAFHDEILNGAHAAGPAARARGGMDQGARLEDRERQPIAHQPCYIRKMKGNWDPANGVK